MKRKLFTYLVLFMSSFFLLCSNYVKADNYVVDYPDNFLDQINDNFYELRDFAILNLDDEYISYFIVYRNNSYQVWYFIESSFISSSNSRLTKWPNSFKICNYDFLNHNYSNCSIMNSSLPSSLLPHLLDTNTEMYYSPNFVEINYLNKNYIFNAENRILSVYDIYQLESGVPIDNFHTEEISVLESFYMLCINKLGYLGEVIVGNYIYLSIIVIFLIFFVFSLVFRRYL